MTDPSPVTQPMTAAWAHYVNSNNLLNELRGLTKNYPFSSDLLDEAKVGLWFFLGNSLLIERRTAPGGQ
jgi:hypothetical protein